LTHSVTAIEWVNDGWYKTLPGIMIDRHEIVIVIPGSAAIDNQP
jgi:hypothetical protein